ncbi:MAG TPA: ABC transporter permease [Candidatus Eremiobacteraceae bacterium]|nr:ABC transporter permease [Candidatus Eremiobacteraceae bacterium]
MNTAGLLRVAFQSLVRNAFRSLLTMLGIIIGVGAVITSMAIGSGAQAAVQAQLARLGSNLIVVVPGSSITGGVQLGAGARQSLKLADATAIQADVPGVAYVAPISSTNSQVVAGGNNWATSIVGTTPSWLAVQNWTLAQGSFFSDSDVRSGAKVAVLGATVATNLFPSGGTIVGRSVIVKSVPFTVIGVLQAKGQSGFGRDQDDQIVVPISAMQLRLNGQTWLGDIFISAQSPDAVTSVVSSTQALLRLRHALTPRAPDDFSVRNIADVQQAASATADVQSRLLAGIAAVSLIVGGIGIMNIMLVSVTERTREIGIRMAVGARERDILMQFLVEAISLSCAGGLIGVLVGIGAAIATSQGAGWAIIIEPMSIVISFVFAALVGIAFGFYPAQRASQLNPIEALRHE